MARTRQGLFSCASYAIPMALEREGAKKLTSVPRRVFAACLAPTCDCPFSPAWTPKNWKRVYDMVLFPANRRTSSSNLVSSHLVNFDKTSLICFYFFSLCTLLGEVSFLSVLPLTVSLLVWVVLWGGGFFWLSCAKDLQRKTDPDYSFSLCPKLF